MSSEPTTQCPAEETLAAFSDGTLDAETRAAVLAHIETCSECMAAVLSANAHLADERRDAPVRTSSMWRWGALAAAAVLIVIVTVPLLRRNEPSIDRLAALSPRTARAVEPRLSGGFDYAPYRGAVRAGDAAADSTRLKLFGVAGEAIEAAENDSSNDAQHIAGIAMLLIDRPADAIERLRVAAEGAPHNAVAWSDLAAARYAAAVQLERPSLLPEALAATDRALRIDPRSPQALFNRALILEHLGLTGEARSAWTRYLAVDGSSEWANEAREHLSRLPAQSGELQFKNELPALERAAVASDSAAVAQIVARLPQQSRAHAEAEHLGLWGESGSDRLLIISRAIGDALVQTTGESLLHDAVAAIDRADAGNRAALARAHVLYRRGRMAYGRGENETGERDLRDAASRFAQLGSPMAFVARYYAASARYDRHEVAAARNELSELRDELETHPHFVALRAQVRWTLALCYMIDADWTGAASLLAQAESGFRAIGERTNLGFVQTLIAFTFTSMGRPDEAWEARIRAFEVLSASGRVDRLVASLGAAARSELRTGRLDPALAMLRLEESSGRAAAADTMIVDALVRQCVVNVALGDEAGAAANAQAAADVVPRIRDAAARERAAADVAFARGTVALHRDPANARQLLTSAIDAYRAQEAPALLPEAYLLRARASMKLRDAAAAMTDLDAGIAIVERHPVDVAGSVAGTGVLDAGAVLFEEMIEAHLDRGDAAAAFAYAERGRSQFTATRRIDAATLQRRLTDTDAAVLELVALPKEVVAFCITARALTVSRTRMARARLQALAEKNELAALYDVLIAPVTLSDARQLIVIPDALLEGVPFAALYDARAKRYLVERVTVSIAPSASSLERGDAPAPRFVLAMALPAGNAVRTAVLPESERELREVRDAYRGLDGTSTTRATFAAFAAGAARAGIIHISGHTGREPGAGEPALVFADERVSWKRIARTSLPSSPIVILAACETLRAPHNPQTQTLSLGGGFLAAGANTVIGTLTPITDGDARELFGAIHRELAAGVPSAAAVRAAQLAAIARGERAAAWKSIGVLTRRIAVRG